MRSSPTSKSRLCACPRCSDDRDGARNVCLRCALKGCTAGRCRCLPTTPAKGHKGAAPVVVDPKVTPPPRPAPVYVEREDLPAAPAAPRREFWTLAELAERHGLTHAALKALLGAAGVRARKRGGYLFEVADAAVESEKARRLAAALPTARPNLAPHEADADGRVGCATCWAMAALSKGRVIVCRWCAAAARGAA